jgi:LPXTG-site transpeptidase (sortase) family protein
MLRQPPFPIAMKPKKRCDPRLRAMRRLEYCLCLVGCGALGYCLFAIGSALIFQVHAARMFDEVRAAASPVEAKAHAARMAEAPNLPLRAGHAVLGRLEIARIGISVMVLDGTDAATLRIGVGHIPETPEPGLGGNTAVAGHRDTFFRALRRIQTGDSIAFETLRGSYIYRVSSVEVVDPSDLAILQPHQKPELTY